MNSVLCNLLQHIREKHALFQRQRAIALYHKNGKRPWSYGYSFVKNDFISSIINAPDNLDYFKNGQQLPSCYGEFLDERVVEYPWLFAHISTSSAKLLDAGSALNYDYLLDHPSLNTKSIFIVTLEPEPNCFSQKRISYVYADLRELLFNDKTFDVIACISTLEHIGLDNTLVYSRDPRYKQDKNDDWLKAIDELKRVLKDEAKLFITVPFGKSINYGWYQQFDAIMIDQLIQRFSPSAFEETYFCYENNGWSISDKKHCALCEGFDIHQTKYFNKNSTKGYDPDFAACSRAIAALELVK